ncbi:MAG: glycosyltransferase [Candidatus Pacearchaeota archaeon]
MKKVSFLIAAHNEEKIIAKTLNNLLNIPYDNFEIIIGLDGCTDKTSSIVAEYAKKNKKIRYFSLNLRSGKPAVINSIIKKANGEIIIVHDADWIFTIRNKKDFNEMISLFNDSNIGGIAESFPMEYHKDTLARANFSYKMTAYATYFWMQFQKENYAQKKGKLLYVKEATMFMTNIFRKSLFKPNNSLGDDFERTSDIIKQKKQVILLDNLDKPRRKTVYTKLSLGDFFKQKIRTAKARKQLAKKERSLGTGYYFKSIGYMIYSSLKSGPTSFFYTLSWIFLTLFASIKSSFYSIDTKKDWQLRAQR